MQLVDEGGEIRESYGFDEFGLPIDGCALNPKEGLTCQNKEFQSWLQPFGYTGYQMEAAGGLYYAQARRYDAAAGRFISKDRIAGFAEAPHTLNRYNYCWNSPMNYVDLDGKWPTIVIGALIGLAITGGVELFSQVKENGWDNVNWSKVAVKAGEGALSGALMGSGVGIGVAVAGNMAISATSSVACDLIDRNDGKDISNGDIALNAVNNAIIGGVAGFIGGKGAASSVAFKSHTVENVVFNIVKTTTRQMAPSSSTIVSSMLVGTVKMLLTTIAINEKGDDVLSVLEKIEKSIYMWFKSLIRNNGECSIME